MSVHCNFGAKYSCILSQMLFRIELNAIHEKFSRWTESWKMMGCWRTFRASDHYCLSSLLTCTLPLSPFFLRSTDFFRFYVQSNRPVTFRNIPQAPWLDVAGSSQHTLKMQLNMHVATQAREVRTHLSYWRSHENYFFNSLRITTAMLLFVPQTNSTKRQYVAVESSQYLPLVLSSAI
jgi:hypothetical protein